MRRRVLLRLLSIGLVVTAVTALAARALSPGPVGIAAGMVLGIAAGALGFSLLLGSSLRRLDRIHEGLARLAEHKPLDHGHDAESGPLSGLGQALDALESRLGAERATHEQRERLLRTVIDATPMAIVLLEDAGRIVYTNQSARDLFFEGKQLEGHNFLAMLSEAPAPFREAVLGNEDALFTVEMQEGEQETYHLAKRYFEFDGETHALVMVKHLTRELRRQEVDIWKKLIRVISHELNNSLAPITSLVHSARLITQQPDPGPRLGRVFDTIEERAKHLQEFVASYARFARLPKPRKEHVDLADFLSHVEHVSPFAKVSPAPGAAGWFDRSQVEQVLINLLKNAQEAGGESESVTLDVASADTGLVFRVGDRGMGMSEEVLAHALLPFYSTKERGTGLGLALSREIVEAHGGKLSLENRQGGGVLVTFTLPGKEVVAPASRAKLTLSRM